MAALHQLIFDGCSNHDATTILASNVYISQAISIQVIFPSDKRTNFPSDPSAHFDTDHHRPSKLILGQCITVKWRNRDRISEQKRGPNREVLVALVRRRQQRRQRDLLAAVGGVDVDSVVVNADAVVRVAGGESDLEGGREEASPGGNVECVDGGVLEDEVGTRGAEDEPD